MTANRREYTDVVTQIAAVSRVLWAGQDSGSSPVVYANSSPENQGDGKEPMTEAELEKLFLALA